MLAPFTPGFRRFMRTTQRVLLHPYALFILIAIMVWMPGGFNVGPVNDG